MGSTLELVAADGHRLSAYSAEPAGRPRGFLVVLQEIFGVTRHIRAMADAYAAAGFHAVAPALFDRIEPNVDVAYSDVARGRTYMQAAPDDLALLDVQAAFAAAAAGAKRGVVGYCWGGTLGYLAAVQQPLDAAVCYYGAGIGRHLAARPRCPVMFHFGESDASIPPATVAAIRAAVPEGVFHVYPAGHGFNCSDRASFEPASAGLAQQRSLEFLHRHLG